MSKVRLLGIVAILAAFLIPIAGALTYHAGRMFVFSDLEGPAETTRLPEHKATSWRDFDAGAPSRLAIFLTDEDSAWLGLAHGLKSLGVPFRITRDVNVALQHRVVLVYPYVSGRVLSQGELQALAAHPGRGGTLVAANVLGGGLDAVFGFKQSIASRERFSFSFQPKALAWLDHTEPEDRSVNLGDQKSGRAPLGTHGYTGATSAIAYFDDGTAAITQRKLGSGAAYALGFDPGFLLLIGQNARGQDLERAYVNAYTPQSDIILRFLRQVWQDGEPLAVSLGRVPEGKPLAVLMTFDIDYTRSLPNAQTYARLLRQHGATGTFFVQTKYIRDYNDAIIMNKDAVQHLSALKDLGMELASHSVAHARAFLEFAMGTGTERYPDYQPAVTAREEAKGGTILGELRVSKFLLERLAQPVRVTSFRPGHLANPGSLPQALEAAGYSYSSSVTAGSSLTHLPFRLNFERGATAETAIYEFPITIEDEKLPPMGERLQEALEVARKIARDGGLFTVLIHPNILGHKLEFANGLLGALKSQAWFGSVSGFGEWWSARDSVQIDVVPRNGNVAVMLTCGRRLTNFPLEVPASWGPLRSGPAQASRNGTNVVVEDCHGSAELEFSVPAIHSGNQAEPG